MTPIILPAKPRILVARTDKIGDVLLTLPAVTALRRKFPQAFIAYLCTSYTSPLLFHHPDISTVIKGDEYSLLGLIANLKENRFDAALHFYIEPRSALASFAAGLPVRVGPLSKWPAVFLSHRLRQNRSRVEKHEAEYNLELAQSLGADGAPDRPRVYLTEGEQRMGREIMDRAVGPGARPVLLHPGSAGSAQNWPLEHFLDLAGKIAKFSPVVFTAGRGEDWILERAKKLNRPNIHAIAAGSLSLRELAAAVAQSRAVVSNSTGPLHLAVALDVPTVSFYPLAPLVTSAKRWGPFGDPRRNLVLSPPSAETPMEKISPESALEAVRRLAAV